MGEVSFNLLLLLLTLGLAILGAVVGAWLQQRSWRQRYDEEKRERLIKAAMATVEELAKLVDRRLYRERRLLWASRGTDSAELEKARNEYQVVLFEWMDNLGRIKAELWRSFGRWTSNRFENEIHNSFASVGRRIESKLRGAERSSLGSEERQLNRLGLTSYQFIHSLLDLIKQERLEGLEGKDVVSYENWSNLSVTFLTKRLLGIRT